MHLIAPSVLAADFTKLADEFAMVNNSTADWFHIDVMDGRFVPNITFGMFVVEAMSRLAQKPLDVHLMIVRPERYLQKFKELGAEIITVHVEACPHLHRTIQQIKELGCKAGVALNPHTPVGVLEEIISDVDLVLLMSVNPGFGGQKFIESTYKKVEKTKKLILESGSKALIEIDGGVNAETAPLLMKAGADVLVAGNFVFNSENPIETIKMLKTIKV